MTAEYTKVKAGQKAKPSTAKVKQAKRSAKKPRRKAGPSANELMLKAWEYTYANRHRRLD
jgi:hypothetical protein